MSSAGKIQGRGPFNSSQIRPGDPYELSNGHPIYCEPAGGRSAHSNYVGASVLGTDPAVMEVGIDVGYSPEKGMLRAPDVAVGNVPNVDGWVEGVPPLAVEYAGVGQDEASLKDKIADFLREGTKWVWVVRLIGPRRVEVHEKDKPMRLAYPGESLAAPGILQNAIRIDELFDKNAAHEATLRNLLQRKGYESLEQIRNEGIQTGIEQGVEKGIEKGIEKGHHAGLEEGARIAIRDICEVLSIPFTDDRQNEIARMKLDELTSLRERIKRLRAWPV